MKAVFLDRDGTLNEDPGYLSHPKQMKLLPGVGEGLRLLKDAGFELIVVSNQSGVGRGIFKETMLPEIHARMNELLAPTGVKIERFYLCTHRPEENCACRKPKPFLIHQAETDLGVDLTNSYMIGDKLSDIEVGENAGVKASVLVRTGNGQETEHKMQPGQAAYIADGFLEAAQWITKGSSKR